MSNYFWVLFFIASFIQAQTNPRELKSIGDNPNSPLIERDSLFLKTKDLKKPSDSLSTFIPSIQDYRYKLNNTAFLPLDTALTIDSYYKQNWAQKDLLTYQQFPNIGQALYPLILESYNRDLSILPTGKKAFYLPADSVKYYDVKTPTTEFLFENGVNEGQFLSTLFTHSPSARWNYAIGYKSLRSLGAYQRQEASHGQTVVSTNYRTKNKRLKVFLNYAKHKINNEENGGIDSIGLVAFKENNPDFSNRQRLAVNLNKTHSEFLEDRFGSKISFGLYKKSSEDSLSNRYPIKINNDFLYKSQDFNYAEDAEETYFGSEVYEEVNRRSGKKFKQYKNYTSVEWTTKKSFSFEAGLLYYFNNLSSETIVTDADNYIPNSLEEHRLGLKGSSQLDLNNRFKINANAEYTTGDLFGSLYNLNATATTNILPKWTISGRLDLEQVSPSLNLIYNPSFYKDFNYYQENFKNESKQKLSVFAKYKPWKTSIGLESTRIQNYTYLDSDFKFQQSQSAISSLAIKLNNKVSYKRFNLNSDIILQSTIDDGGIYPIPNFIARLTPYYSTMLSNKSAQVMAGLNITYYSAFKAREFFPILNEFNLQSDPSENIGNTPQIDAFFNLKVRRMRIYIRTENLNSFIQKGKQFSTPLNPYREFKLQFGVHWFLFT